MVRLHISDYSTTATENTDINTVNVGEGSNMSLMNNAHRASAKVLADFYDDLGGTLTVAGTADAITVAGSIQTLDAGQILMFVPSGDNTIAGVTLDWNSKGAKSVKKIIGGAVSSLKAGDIKDGRHALVIYDGTQFILTNPDVTGDPDAILEDQKAVSTNGGDATTGVWATRVINTVVSDPDSLITLSSNQFTPSVNGWVMWESPAFAVGRFKTRLYNITDSTYVEGDPAYSNVTNPTQATSDYYADVEAGKTYEVKMRVETSKTGNGFGVAAGWGDEKYTKVLFWRT